MEFSNISIHVCFLWIKVSPFNSALHQLLRVKSVFNYQMLHCISLLSANFFMPDRVHALLSKVNIIMYTKWKIEEYKQTKIVKLWADTLKQRPVKVTQLIGAEGSRSLGPINVNRFTDSCEIHCCSKILCHGHFNKELFCDFLKCWIKCFMVFVVAKIFLWDKQKE